VHNQNAPEIDRDVKMLDGNNEDYLNAFFQAYIRAREHERRNSLSADNLWTGNVLKSHITFLRHI
jgi:hypothetical protein